MPQETKTQKTAMIKMPKHVRDIVTAPIPDALIKERDGGGGKKLSYISGSSVIDLLNAAFGYMWNWEVTQEWIQESIPFFNQYSKVPDGEKVNHMGKRGAWEDQAPVAHVKGRLHVFFYDEAGIERKIMKEGFGSKSVLGKQNDQESIFKAAGTDALKKAASLLGIGAELYRDEDEQSYFDQLNYEDPWTEEALVQYKAERDYLTAVMAEYNFGVEDMDGYVAEFSEGELTELSQIVPENIKPFVDYMKALQAAAEEAKKAEEEPKKKSPLSK